MADELRSCPSCGALPCDWTDNPFTRPSTPPAVSDDLVDPAKELGLLYNFTNDDSRQFTREQMMVAIMHGYRLIHRREQQAAEAMRERCAEFIQENYPHDKRALVPAIRSLTTEVGEGKGAQ